MKQQKRKDPDDRLCVECQENDKKEGYDLCPICLDNEVYAMKYGVS